MGTAPIKFLHSFKCFQLTVRVHKERLEYLEKLWFASIVSCDMIDTFLDLAKT